MTTPLTDTELADLRRQFTEAGRYQLLQNAIAQHPVEDVALDRRLVNQSRAVSHRLDDWDATSQNDSGRCWIFAGLNLLRVGAAAKLGVRDFEFSQSYLMFWDKLERANYFLNAVAATADRPIDDRTVARLLEAVADDGGQWNMFVALIEKHGVVPKVVMPETQSSSNSARMNTNLRTVLRGAALRVRRATSADEVAQIRAETLSAVYRLLALHLGTPPDRFTWQWADKDGTFHRDGELTPKQFADRYIALPIQDYVCLVDDPRPSSPRGRAFTVEWLGNVAGAPPVVYLNAGIDVMRELAAESITAGEPVWFGCDTAQMRRVDVGLWDADLYDYGSVYDTAFELTKGERLEAHESLMTHAMLFTGVDLVDGRPRRWRVENSTGTQQAEKGFWIMNDSWFGEYVFEIAVRRDRLPSELRDALDTEPVVLPAWDPMGALAG